MATATQENVIEKGITLTSAAAERVREFMAREGGVGLRLSVKRTGCSGWAYDVGLAHDTGPDDHIFEDQGIKIIVDDKALAMIAGTRIDFVHQGLVREFRFTNPNVTGECGCGESFTVNG